MPVSKSIIFAAAINKHKSVIDDFVRRIKELMATEGNVNEEEYDNSEQSIKSRQLREVEMLDRELKFAQEELRGLTKLQRSVGVCDRVAPGAVVHTENDKYFVSASIEEFQAGNDNYFGISTESPIYKAMKGKEQGESFKLGSRDYTILSVY